MTVDITRTRTSDRWVSRPPGNMDRLHASVIFPADDLGIPILKGTQVIPEHLVAWNARPEPDWTSCWHFYLDDYRFESLWNRPEQTMRRVRLLGMALSPDFSLWLEMPPVMQMWQVYRSRWLAALWEINGVSVIPTISWSDEKSFEYAFRGLPVGSVVSVSTVGTARYPDNHAPFLAGYEQMMNTLKPTLVLCYGRPLEGMTGNIRQYPTRWGRL